MHTRTHTSLGTPPPFITHRTSTRHYLKRIRASLSQVVEDRDALKLRLQVREDHIVSQVGAGVEGSVLAGTFVICMQPALSIVFVTSPREWE